MTLPLGNLTDTRYPDPRIDQLDLVPSLHSDGLQTAGTGVNSRSLSTRIATEIAPPSCAPATGSVG